MSEDVHDVQKAEMPKQVPNDSDSVNHLDFDALIDDIYEDVNNMSPEQITVIAKDMGLRTVDDF